MPVIVEINIKASGGDYSNLRTAILAMVTDLVAADLVHKYIIHNDFGADGHNYSTGSSYLDFRGYVTSEVNNVIITCLDEDRTNGIIGSGARLYKSGASYLYAFRSQYVVFDGIEFYAPNANSRAGSGEQARMTNCLLHNCFDPIHSLTNTICIDIPHYIGINADHVTSIRSGSHSGDIAFHTAYVNNSLVFKDVPKITYDAFYQNRVVSDYNAINDLGDGQTANGTNNFTVSESDFVDYAGGNYNLSPTSPLYTAGSGGTPIGAVLSVAAATIIGSAVSINKAVSVITGIKKAFGKVLSSAKTQSSVIASKSAVGVVQSSNSNQTILSGKKSASGYLISQVVVSSTVSGFANDLIKKSGFALSSNKPLSVVQGSKKGRGAITSLNTTNTIIDAYKSGKGSAVSSVIVSTLTNGFKCSFGSVVSTSAVNTVVFGYKSNLESTISKVTIQGAIVQPTLSGHYQSAIIIQGVLDA